MGDESQRRCLKEFDGNGVQQKSALLTIVRAPQRSLICSLSKAWATRRELGTRLSTVSTSPSIRTSAFQSMRLSMKSVDVGSADGLLFAVIGMSGPEAHVQCTALRVGLRQWMTKYCLFRAASSWSDAVG